MDFADLRRSTRQKTPRIRRSRVVERERMFKPILTLISRTRTEVLVGILYLIGMLLLFTVSSATPGNIDDPVRNAVISLALFFWGLAGIPVIIRKDVRTGFFHLKGWPAVISGILMTVTFFFGALLPWLPRFPR